MKLPIPRGATEGSPSPVLVGRGGSLYIHARHAGRASEPQVGGILAKAPAPAPSYLKVAFSACASPLPQLVGWEGQAGPSSSPARQAGLPAARPKRSPNAPRWASNQDQKILSEALSSHTTKRTHDFRARSRPDLHEPSVPRQTRRQESIRACTIMRQGTLTWELKK